MATVMGCLPFEYMFHYIALHLARGFALETLSGFEVSGHVGRPMGQGANGGL